MFDYPLGSYCDTDANCEYMINNYSDFELWLIAYGYYYIQVAFTAVILTVIAAVICLIFVAED